MIAAGYLYKQVASRPDWLKAENLADIYSLSNCTSKDFADYIGYWKHNGYWLFDSPEIITALAAAERIELSGMSLFYYEFFEREYDEDTSQWSSFASETSFRTDVRPPPDRRLEGFDVITVGSAGLPEHSPLSCNSLADEIPANRHCLLDTLDDTLRAIESGLFEASEPGPFRIAAVYTIEPR